MVNLLYFYRQKNIWFLFYHYMELWRNWLLPWRWQQTNFLCKGYLRSVITGVIDMEVQQVTSLNMSSWWWSINQLGELNLEMTLNICINASECFVLSLLYNVVIHSYDQLSHKIQRSLISRIFYIIFRCLISVLKQISCWGFQCADIKGCYRFN